MASDEPLPRLPLPSVVTAMVRGARHVREDKPCQDAILVRSEGDYVALAIADGHGSSVHGDIGAQVAVDVATTHLLGFAKELERANIADLRQIQALAQHPLRPQITRDWTERIQVYMTTNDTTLSAYGSTLLFVLAGPGYLLLGQLGDGDILRVDSATRVHRPIPPDPENFADETTSLCQRDAWGRMCVSVTHPPDSETLVLLSTDGYSKSYETDSIFELIGPDYLTMFREDGAASVQAALPQILEQVTHQGSGDDIAIGMLCWRGPTPIPAKPPESVERNEETEAQDQHEKDTENQP